MKVDHDNDHYFRCIIQMLCSVPLHPSLLPLWPMGMTSLPLATVPLALPINKCCRGRHLIVSLATRLATSFVYGHYWIIQLTGTWLTDWLSVCPFQLVTYGGLLNYSVIYDIPLDNEDHSLPAQSDIIIEVKKDFFLNHCCSYPDPLSHINTLSRP